MKKAIAAAMLSFMTVPAWAQQGDVAAHCSGTNGKTFACCERVVTAYPNIGQCEKERAVFRCVGAKTYVSPYGCGTFVREKRRLMDRIRRKPK